MATAMTAQRPSGFDPHSDSTRGGRKRAQIGARERNRGAAFDLDSDLGQPMERKLNGTTKVEAFTINPGGNAGRGYTDEEISAASLRYPQCKNVVFRPSYADDGSYGVNEAGVGPSPEHLAKPEASMTLEYVHGYHSTGFHQTNDVNALYMGDDDDKVVYQTAALVVIQDLETYEQVFFDLHDDDVTALALHPDGRTIASGQVGKAPPVLVWDGEAAHYEGTNMLSHQCVMATLSGHARKVRCLNFSHDGHFLVSSGEDNHHSVIVWAWQEGTQIAMVGGGSCPLDQLKFNPFQAFGVPLSDVATAGQASDEEDACYCLTSVSPRHIRFWTLRKKEGAWCLEGKNGRLGDSAAVQEYTTMEFIDDSPSRQVLSSTGTVQTMLGVSDRTMSRVVVGTKTGNFFIFQQPPQIDKRKAFDEPWWLARSTKAIKSATPRGWQSTGVLLRTMLSDVNEANARALDDRRKAEIETARAQLKAAGRQENLREELLTKIEKLSYQGQLTGHSGGITATAFNDAKAEFISAGADGKMVRWNAHHEHQGKFVLAFLDPNEAAAKASQVTDFGSPIKSVSWASDGSRLLVGTTSNDLYEMIMNDRVELVDDEADQDGLDKDGPTRRVVHVGAPKVVQLVQGHVGRLDALDVFPNRPEFVTVAKDRQLTIWDIEEKRALVSYPIRGDSLTLACRQDGSEIAVGMAAKTEVHMIAVERGPDGKPTKMQLKSVMHQNIPTGGANYVAVGGGGVEMPGLGFGSTSPRRSSQTTGLDFTTNLMGTNGLVTAGGALPGPVGGGTISKTRPARGGEGSGSSGSGGPPKKEFIPGLGLGVVVVKYSPCGRFLAAGTRSSSIIIFAVHMDDATQYKRICELTGHSSTVTHLDWSEDSTFIQTNARDSQILYWQILPSPLGATKGSNGTGSSTSSGGFRPSIFPKSFLMRDMKWASWSCILGWPVQGIFPPDTDNTDINQVAYCPEYDILASADDFKTLRLLRFPVLKNAQHRDSFGHSSHVMGLTFTKGISPIRLITAGGLDSTICQWILRGPGDYERQEEAEQTHLGQMLDQRQPGGGREVEPEPDDPDLGALLDAQMNKRAGVRSAGNKGNDIDIEKDDADLGALLVAAKGQDDDEGGTAAASKQGKEQEQKNEDDNDNDLGPLQQAKAFVKEEMLGEGESDEASAAGQLRPASPALAAPQENVEDGKK